MNNSWKNTLLLACFVALLALIMFNAFQLRQIQGEFALLSQELKMMRELIANHPIHATMPDQQKNIQSTMTGLIIPTPQILPSQQIPKEGYGLDGRPLPIDKKQPTSRDTVNQAYEFGPVKLKTAIP